MNRSVSIGGVSTTEKMFEVHRLTGDVTTGAAGRRVVSGDTGGRVVVAGMPDRRTEREIALEEHRNEKSR